MGDDKWRTIAGRLKAAFQGDNAADNDAELLFDQICRAQVGRLGFVEAQRRLRENMFYQAFLLSEGNRSAAARILGINRRYVQKMLAELQFNRNVEDDSQQGGGA